LACADGSYVSARAGPDDCYIKRRLFLHLSTPAGLEDVEIVLVKQWIGLHDDVLFRPVFKFVQ
jgi:hypothetical protein